MNSNQALVPIPVGNGEVCLDLTGGDKALADTLRKVRADGTNDQKAAVVKMLPTVRRFMTDGVEVNIGHAADWTGSFWDEIDNIRAAVPDAIRTITATQKIPVKVWLSLVGFRDLKEHEPMKAYPSWMTVEQYSGIMSQVVPGGGGFGDSESSLEAMLALMRHEIVIGRRDWFVDNDRPPTFPEQDATHQRMILLTTDETAWTHNATFANVRQALDHGGFRLGLAVKLSRPADQTFWRQLARQDDILTDVDGDLRGLVRLLNIAIPQAVSQATTGIVKEALTLLQAPPSTAVARA